MLQIETAVRAHQSEGVDCIIDPLHVSFWGPVYSARSEIRSFRGRQSQSSFSIISIVSQFEKKKKKKLDKNKMCAAVRREDRNLQNGQ